ncbi:MAG TPA: hypothetical protein VFJ53_03275 [Solirubrobacterales bacterium]|nr:hypothetical protein [Solirubrobacterales bacterium]
MAARSKIVRCTEVVGIPSSSARSSAGTTEKCLRIRFVELLLRGTVTWIAPPE